jgi:hypothetical protein
MGRAGQSAYADLNRLRETHRRRSMGFAQAAEIAGALV